jgi:hypothetical protein
MKINKHRRPELAQSKVRASAIGCAYDQSHMTKESCRVLRTAASIVAMIGAEIRSAVCRCCTGG